MIKKYTEAEMRVRDEFAAVALRHWLEEFRKLKKRKPDSSFSQYKQSIARASFYMADSMMAAREELVEITTSPEL